VRIILSELTEEFWILRARQAIKKVPHRCLPYKVAEAYHGHQIEAPLPADRVIPQKPFEVTGIDFAGPLYIKVGSNMRKCYIALFKCVTTLAVHLELCTDMSTDKFCWLFNDMFGDEDYHKPFTRTTLRPFMPPKNTELNYGPVDLQPKLTNSSPSQHSLDIYCSEGSLVGRMVGEDDRNYETLST